MRTYGAVERKTYGSDSTRIMTNPDGGQLNFWMSRGVVANMLVAESAQSIIDHGQC